MHQLSSVCFINFTLLKGIMEGLKAFWAEYCVFRYNSLAEACEL